MACNSLPAHHRDPTLNCQQLQNCIENTFFVVPKHVAHEGHCVIALYELCKSRLLLLLLVLQLLRLLTTRTERPRDFVYSI